MKPIEYLTKNLSGIDEHSIHAAVNNSILSDEKPISVSKIVSKQNSPPNIDSGFLSSDTQKQELLLS